MDLITQMLITRGEVPGLPAAGHTDNGYWHPGARSTCHKGNCERLRKEKEKRRHG